MTSNVGTQHVRKSATLGFQAAMGRDDQARVHDLVEQELKRTFRPEFLNRIDEIVVFDPLTEEQIGQIVELQVAELRKMLAERNLLVELTSAAKEWLAREGFDPSYGARPLRRTIQRWVENPLAKRLLAGEFKAGDTVLVDVGPEGLTFARREAPVPA
jgi:ATP-dependent Clp protease ATP-binding subunit ClpC